MYPLQQGSPKDLSIQKKETGPYKTCGHTRSSAGFDVRISGSHSYLCSLVSFNTALDGRDESQLAFFPLIFFKNPSAVS